MKVPEKGKQYGLLGGTFDPVHLGHIQLAKDIKNAKHLDGVFCLPSYTHPFKNNKESTTYDNRIAMLNLAIEDHPALAILEIEKEYGLSGYTIDTVKMIKALYPSSTFYFIIGADNIKGLDSWYHPDEIIDEMKIVAGSRPESEVETGKYASYIEYIETSMLDISSSGIKSMIGESGYVDRLLSYLEPKVFDYIRNRKIYL